MQETAPNAFNLISNLQYQRREVVTGTDYKIEILNKKKKSVRERLGFQSPAIIRSFKNI